MSKNDLNHIANEIKHYSDGDDRLGEMLSYCLGRLCLKSAKAGTLWRKELSSIDVPHIVDWLKAAIINEADWLNNVDDQNRPKKLMKFGSLEDVQKEADKAMFRANQQNHGIKLIDGDEELHMQLEDGFHLVKLLTPAALDREGYQMQHCIGGGAYDKALNSDEHYFLSLRDRFGKPHATLEVSGNNLDQLQGKQNQAPNIKYTKALKPFFAQEKLAINMCIKSLGYIVSSEGNTYDIGDLPDGLEVNGDLNLYEAPIKSLPKGLKVGGNLNLGWTPIKSLPEGLEVGRDLYLLGVSIKSLPEGLKVGGNLDLYGTSVQELPEGLKVGGNLNLERTPIKPMPEGLEVNGDLNLYGTSVQELPEGLKVGGNLNLERTPIKSLPEGLKVGGNLNLERTPIKSLPEGLKVGGELCLYGTPIKSLPEGLKVDGYLHLCGTSIQELPESFEIGGHLNLRETPIKSLPEGLKVGGDLCLYEVPIKSLPKGMEVGGYLDLRRTDIRSLPESLTVDGDLYLRETPIKSLPEGLKVGGRILGFTPELDQQNKAVCFSG